MYCGHRNLEILYVEEEDTDEVAILEISHLILLKLNNQITASADGKAVSFEGKDQWTAPCK